MYNIIPPNEIMLSEAILEEKYNMLELLNCIAENDSCIKWLVRRNLLRNFLRCSRLKFS